MKFTNGITKLLICGVALASIASLGSGITSNVVASANSNTNHVYQRMLDIETDDSHVSKPFAHQFIANLHRFSASQLSHLKDNDNLGLTHHEKAEFNKIYNKKVAHQHINKHAKFNTKHIYNLFIKNSVSYDVAISKQDKYDFMKMIPKLSYGQLKNIFKHNDYSNSDVTNTYGNKLGKAIIKRYHAFKNRKLTNTINKDLAKQNQSITPFDREVASSEFKAVNAMRARHGLRPVKYDAGLQAIANMRAPQALKAENESIVYKYETEQSYGNDTDGDNLAHGMDWHETNEDDAKKLGFSIWDIHNSNTFNENLATTSIGKVYVPADNCGDKGFVADHHTPKKIGQGDVYEMVHYDKASHNTHRKAILDPKAKYLAVSTVQNNKYSYQGGRPIVTIEEFAE